ncbi:MAG: translocation/assembly module TamB domain-containing protein [Calothrix sp. MO_167.B42]|nr:translocation/assembly module TamB domain-containing protein [Calothrix sp. MO_167.B42]
MTSPNTPPEDNSVETPNSQPRRFWVHRTIAGFGLTLVGIGIVGYVSVNNWIRQELPSFLETELSKILKRQVNVGEVKGLGLTDIQFGNSSIPATSTDSDYVSIEAINVSFNPIPVLLSRTLPFSVTLVKPTVYIEENNQGEWVNTDAFELEEGEPLPINFNATVILQNAKVVLSSRNQNTPFNTQINGFINYNQTQPETVKYKINADIAKGNLDIQGETKIKTGQTQASTKIKQLSLGEFNTFIPQNFTKISQGKLNGNLQINLPSFSQLPVVQGQANIQKVRAKIKQLPLPINASTSLKFAGKTIKFTQTTGNYGNLKTFVSGDVDLNRGFNLKIDTNPVNLAVLAKNLPIKLPVSIDGKLKAQMFLRGAFKNPLLLGSITSKEKINIAKTEIANFQAKFVGNTSQFLLQDLRLTPAAGGEITAKGNVKFIDSKTGKVNFNQAQLAFDLDANLPKPLAILSPYGVNQQLVKLDRITAQGKIRGTPQNPQGILSWNLPNGNISSTQLSGNGEILLTGKQITLQNTALETDKGNIDISGQANLPQQNWQVNVDSQDLLLNPLISELAIDNQLSNEPIFLNKGRIKLTGRLDNFDLNNITANANLNLDVTQGKVVVNTQINRGNLQAIATAREIILNKLLPDLPIALNVVNSQVKVAGSVQQLLSLGDENNLDSFRVTTSGQLKSPAVQGKGIINFNGKGNLATQNWQASIQANSLPLTPVISQLQLTDFQVNQPVTLNQANIDLAGKIDNLDLANNLANIEGIANLNLNVNDGNIAINSRLNRGLVETQATARSIALAKLIPDLSLPVNLIDSRINFSSSVEQLLALDLSNITANAAAQVAVAQGKINTLVQLNNGEFSSNITANNVNTPIICRSIASPCPQLANLSSQVSLVGNIQSLLQDKSPATIQAKTAYLKVGEQSINANGKILLTPVSNQPIPWDVATELDIVANSNLNRLYATLVPQNQSETTVDGKAKFQGKLLGKNLLSAPFAPGNFTLLGDLQLRNFAIDEIKFQPLLAGTVNIDLGKVIAIDLQGVNNNNNQDRIAANLQPCNRQECPYPYLPTSFELKQGTGEKAILLSGKRQIDTLDIQIQNFSLALLNPLPIVKEQIPGSIAGNVTGEIDINLFNLATTVNIQVDSPDLGYIKAKEVAANFAYDGEVAQLSSASIKLRDSQYDFQGKLDINSGDINGKVETKSAQLQDIFAAINLPLIESLFTDNVAEDYGNASDVQTKPVGNPQATIFAQLRLLSRIRNQLQRLTAQTENQPIQFNPLNIQGDYSTEINIAGKLTNPEVDFQLDGKNWLWNYQAQEITNQSSNNPNQTKNQQLKIDRIIAKGSWKNGVVQLEPVRVSLEDALIAFQGKLGLEEVSGLFKIDNFPINTVQRFVDLPVELAGKLNMQANLDGSLFEPQVSQGQVSLVDGTIDRQPIGELAGKFSYLDSNFKFNTTPTSSIQLQASIPYPDQEDGNNSVLIDTKFGSKLFPLLGPLTQGQLQWIEGNGEIAFKLEGPLNWQAKTAPEFISNATANSTIQIANATVKTKQLGEEINFQVAGNFALENDIIQLEKLEGNVAGSPFLIAGVLPLFQPIPDTSNPLTLTMGPGKLNLQGLYKGEIDGNVIISETVMNPVIEGKVHLHDGRVFIPESNNNSSSDSNNNNNTPTPVKTSKKQTQPENPSPGILPRFQDFQIVIGNKFRFKQSLPKTNFKFAGQVTLNGLLNQLQPQGTIKLKRGRINLFDNKFALSRTYDQKIEFVPEQGLLNPKLNIQLQTIVLDASQFERRQPIDTEIREDIVTPANPNRIDVRVTIQGNASQLLSNLDPSTSPCKSQSGNIPPITTTEGVPQLSPQALQTIANCIDYNSEVGIQKRQWLTNPAIEMTSTPERNETEIIALLSNRTIGSILDIQKQISSGNGAEVVSSGVIQYLTGNLLANVEQEILWGIQQPFDTAAKNIGLTHFQIIPSVQGVRHIDANSSIRFIYDYSNFFYQSIFSGNNDDSFDSQFRVIYQRRF